MSNFDSIKSKEGKEFLIFDSSELYDDSQMGNKSDDFEILKILGEGGFGQVFKVVSKFNNKVYAMKRLDLEKIKKMGEDALRLAKNETEFLQRLSHPHIIKYYRSFPEGNFLYIIIEYARNGDLKDFIEAHRIFNKHIPEEEVWNIFLQCMEALVCIHKNNIIHRDIKPRNIFLDNNMVIKIGDFGTSAIKRENKYLKGKYLFPIKNEEKMQYHGTFVASKGYTAQEVYAQDYDHKADVYSMGVTFYEICYFHIPTFRQVIDQSGKQVFMREENNEDKKVNYSLDLLNIIYLMLEQDKDKRKSSSEILKMIQNEYTRKFFRNTSIDSIVRCLFSFNSLTNKFFNIPPNQLQNKPITQAYIECLKCVTKPLSQWINSINYIRKALGIQNPKLESGKEIDPRLVFAFLVKELHLELNNSFYLPNNDKHLIVSGEEISKTSKVEMMIKFINEVLSKMNTFLSNDLFGLINTTNICSICNIKTFKFNNYFFITINLEKILGNNYNIPYINLQDNLTFQNENKELYCSKCLNKTEHFCYKNYYFFPNLLIFSIQRGITFQYKTRINIQANLNLTQIPGFQNSNFYNLVGILKRKVKSGNEIYFSIILFNQRWYLCEGDKVNITNPPFQTDPEGDTIMLFYQKIM